MSISYQLQLTLQFILVEGWHLLYQKMKRKIWTNEEKTEESLLLPQTSLFLQFS